MVLDWVLLGFTEYPEVEKITQKRFDMVDEFIQGQMSQNNGAVVVELKIEYVQTWNEGLEPTRAAWGGSLPTGNRHRSSQRASSPTNGWIPHVLEWKYQQGAVASAPASMNYGGSGTSSVCRCLTGD
ncbi:hypothetical protein SAY87_000234 [Trapa incisa]|uniref:Uncharacterized protein n=1 Tax=Trapa incisa TaxID=236973 RepID=A0AAN7GLY7_9MYRT|nr:hypothetical protein SAY87_000234 [Trapa incisa]